MGLSTGYYLCRSTNSNSTSIGADKVPATVKLPSNQLPEASSSANAQPHDNSTGAPASNILNEFKPLPIVAKIQVANKSYELKPNIAGIFEQVHIEPKAKIAVQINYPHGEAGEKVIVESEDGGVFANNKIVQVQELDAAGNLNFTFNATEQYGIFRVTLRRASDMEELHFWSGPEPTFAKH